MGSVVLEFLNNKEIKNEPNFIMKERFYFNMREVAYLDFRGAPSVRLMR